MSYNYYRLYQLQILHEREIIYIILIEWSVAHWWNIICVQIMSSQK